MEAGGQQSPPIVGDVSHWHLRSLVLVKYSFCLANCSKLLLEFRIKYRIYLAVTCARTKPENKSNQDKFTVYALEILCYFARFLLQNARFCEETRRNFEATLAWLQEHACSRTYGLGECFSSAISADNKFF